MYKVLFTVFLAGCHIHSADLLASEAFDPNSVEDNCSSDSDCFMGETCQPMEFACGMECAPKPDLCTLDLVVWCGCDGFMYYGSSTLECMTIPVDYLGLCEGASLSGLTCVGDSCCESDNDCADGFECVRGICR